MVDSRGLEGATEVAPPPRVPICARTEKANDDEMIVGLAQLAAMIGDGHTHIDPPSNVHRLPVAIGLFGDDHRITRASDEAIAFLGGRIIRIDDTPIAEAEKRLRSVIARDENEPFVRGALPSSVLVGEFLHGLKITNNVLSARITVARLAGERSVEVATVPGATNPMIWPSASQAAPLWRQHVDDPLFVTYIEPSKPVYVQHLLPQALNIPRQNLHTSYSRTFDWESRKVSLTP